MQLRIRSITYLAADVLGFELTDPNEHDLPRFTAGAHVAIRVKPGLLRDYSLCNDPAERRRYCIAVLKEKEGYGSNALHETARVGDLLEVSWPRNLFPLVEEAERHWMIAGGIGITPFMAMIAELRRRRADFHLYYCSRTPERTAFREDLSLLAATGKVTFHYDDGDPSKGLDVATLLTEPPPLRWVARYRRYPATAGRDANRRRDRRVLGTSCRGGGEGDRRDTQRLT